MFYKLALFAFIKRIIIHSIFEEVTVLIKTVWNTTLTIFKSQNSVESLKDTFAK